jgi:ribosomal protein S27E
MMDPEELADVECPECGNTQPDMGHGVTCEQCGYGPMPTADGEGAD